MLLHSKSSLCSEQGMQRTCTALTDAAAAGATAVLAASSGGAAELVRLLSLLGALGP